MNWWDPENWKARGARSVSSISLEGADPSNIRNGWLTLPEPKARFQQKQMQEREMKIASLYEAQQARALGRVRLSPSNGVSSNSASPPPPAPTGSHQPGKVRQMFEERRTKGIDKSYPLQPIQNTERPARKPLPNGYTKVTTSSSRTSVEKKTTKTHSSGSLHNVKRQQVVQKSENIVNGKGDLNHNHETDLNSNITREVAQSIDALDKAENSYLLENETFPEVLAPTPTPRTPEHAEPKKPVRKSPASRKSPARTKPQPPTSPPRKTVSDNAVTDSSSKGREAMHRGVKPVPRRHPVASSSSKAAGAVGGGGAGGPGSAGAGAGCAVCGRRFAPDRLQKHQEICAKAHAKKRKPFDALKHRLAGTEAEPLIGKLRKGNTSSTKVSTNKPLNNNWRQKHEEFIQAIRAAKQVQAHLNAGGKLSDLPPPPPSENPDYVQCPHCSRRFNQGAAERHIPKCASYQFNKPKPAASKRR